MNDPKNYIQIIVVDDGRIPSIIKIVNGFSPTLIFYPFLNRHSALRFLIFIFLIASQAATTIGFLKQRMDQWNVRKRW
jgi:hypothetical protein